ncbi:hypothetical protein CCP4SC76_390027 [Gammaproteobacteria bacterium]
MSDIYIGIDAHYARLYASYQKKIDDEDAFDAALEKIMEAGEDFYPFSPDNLMEWMDNQEEVFEVLGLLAEDKTERAWCRFKYLAGQYWEQKARKYLSTPKDDY